MTSFREDGKEFMLTVCSAKLNSPNMLSGRGLVAGVLGKIMVYVLLV